jgi:translocation and assembly module TamB
MTAPDAAPDPGTEAGATPRGRMTAGRVMMRIGIAAALLLLLIVVAVGGGVLFLRTDGGLDVLRRGVEWAASSDQVQLRIGALDGPFPERLRIVDLTLSDDAGTMIAVSDAELRWRPRDLLSRRLSVDAISVGTVDVHRLPAAEPDETPPSDTFDISLPSLPLDVEVRSLSIGEAWLDAAVAGTPVAFNAEGSLAMTRDGTLNVALNAQRRDGVEARAAFVADYRAAAKTLKLTLDAAEPAGGVVAGLLDLPGRPPVSATIDGDGPLDNWRGQFDASAEGVAQIVGEVALSGSQPTAIHLQADADIEAALDPAAAPLAVGGVVLAADASVDGQTITVTSLTLAAAAGDLAARGAYDRQAETLDGSARITLGPAQVFDRLAPGVRYRAASGDLEVKGALPVPTTRLSLTAEGVSTDAADIETLEADMHIDPGQGGGAAAIPSFAYTVDADLGGVRTLKADLKPLLADGVHLAASGTVADDAHRLTVERLALTAGPAEVNGHGEVDMAEPLNGHGMLDVTSLELAPLSELLGTPIGGTTTMAVSVTASPGEGVTATLSGAVDGLSTAFPELDTLAGPRVAVNARVRGEEGAPYRADATIAGTGVKAVAAGTLSPELDALADAHLDVTVPDLAPLRSAVPDLTGGRATLSVTAEGPLDTLSTRARLDGSRIVLGQHRLDQVTAVVDATDVPRRPRGTLGLDVTGTPGALTLSGPFAVAENDTLSLPALALTYERVLKATGDLVLRLDGGPAVGHVSVRVDDVAPIGDRWGVPVSGQVSVDATLSADAGRQGVRGTANAFDLRYGPPADATAAIETMTASFAIADADAENLNGVSVNANAEGIDVADGRLDRTTATLDGSGETFRLRAETSGDVQGLHRLATEAEVRLGDRTDIVIQSLDGELAGDALRLANPARLSVGVDSLTIADLTVLYGKAQADVALQTSARTVDGRLALRDVDLSVIDRFAPGTGLTGQMVADARLSGDPRAPRVDLTAKATNLGSSGAPTAGGKASPANATLTATVERGRMTSRLTVAAKDSAGTQPFQAQLDAPIVLGITPFRFDVPENGPIAGSATWQGPIGTLVRMLPIDDLILDGATDIDLAIAGTVGRPSLNGRIVIDKGRLEVFETGTILTPLNVEVQFRDQNLRVVRLDSGDGSGGRIDGAGGYDWGGVANADLNLTIRNATLVRRDDVTSRMSGTAKFRGVVGERAQLTVALTNDSTEIRLVNRLPPSIPTIPVVMADDLKNRADLPPPSAPEDEEPEWLTLDARVDAPRRVFVRGRGLDSEWGGSLSATGPLDALDVHGRIEPIRGELSILGKNFVLQSGSIVIDGLDQNPRIDVTAAYTRSDFRALITVSGTPAAPKLTMSSVPELPQDEILSQILLNKGSGRLTPGEALQIAAAARSLSSGEPGVLDRLRDATGLDRLTVGGGDENEGIGAVEAGRYVTDRVYTGVEQGATAGSTAVVVEVNITDTIKARSSNSGDGLHRFGVNWSIDY